LTEEFGQTEVVRRRRITLIGLPVPEKYLGRALAKGMRGLYELDQEIEREAGMSLSNVPSLWQAGYRKIERRCLERSSTPGRHRPQRRGGIVSEPETYELLLLNVSLCGSRPLRKSTCHVSWSRRPATDVRTL